MQYVRALENVLGMHVVCGGSFYDTLKAMHPHVKNILDDICNEAKEEMKSMDPLVSGSWGRAVTVADAVWLTRGGFSRNGTYTVRNYLTGALLYTTCTRVSCTAVPLRAWKVTVPMFSSREPRMMV